MQTETAKTLDKILPVTLPGAVCVQWRTCGKTGCRCTSGQKHGPYYYRCWRAGGKLNMQYIKRAEVAAVQAACKQRQMKERELRQTLQQSNAEWKRLRAALRHYGM